MNYINDLLRILINNYNIYNIDIYIYYICLDKELLYNFKNILVNINYLPTNLDYYINNKNDIINSIHRYLFNNDYIVKDYYINEYNMVYIIFNKLYKIYKSFINILIFFTPSQTFKTLT